MPRTLRVNARAFDRRGNILTVPITDTSPAAQALQLQVQRAMPGERRLLMALETSLFTRELAKECVRREHPEWSDTQIALELVRRAFLPEPVPARFHCAHLRLDGADDRT